MPWWLLRQREEERRYLEEQWRRQEEERRRQEEEERRRREEAERRRLEEAERRRREEEEERRREEEARQTLRGVLVGSRFAPMVHGMLRWLAVLPGDLVRVSELAMRTTYWLQEALNHPDARANAVMLGAYAGYLRLVREKEFRRGRRLVAYRVDKARVQRMLRLLEEDVELGALCWTGRAIYGWVGAAVRKTDDASRLRLRRLGVHYVYLFREGSLHFDVAPARVMLSQAWDKPVPWRAGQNGVTVEPPWGAV
jgi:hypothetical protein